MLYVEEIFEEWRQVISKNQNKKSTYLFQYPYQLIFSYAGKEASIASKSPWGVDTSLPHFPQYNILQVLHIRNCLSFTIRI
jgi:hypothetical protein